MSVASGAQKIQPQQQHQRRQILVALGVIFNDVGEIIVARRNDPRNKSNHNKWEFPGGKIEFGEHPSQAVVREIREEIGVATSVVRLHNIYSWHHVDRKHIQIILIVYVLKLAPNQQPRPSCREVKEVRLMTPEQALKLDQLPNNKQILRDIINSV